MLSATDCDFRFGSKAEITPRRGEVRFARETGHRLEFMMV